MSDIENDVALFALRVWTYKQGESVALLIHLGDRLGLYRALDGSGPMTADQLADRTRLNPRWLLEWLRGNAAAGLIESSDGDTFELSPAGAEVLAREDTSLWFAAGAFTALIDASIADDVSQSFETGVGLPYDRHGPQGAHLTERSLGPWARLALLPRIVPALEGVEAKLEQGALVADVGCGAGVALTTLAAAFPASTFHGYELSRHALDRARERVGELGLGNVELFATRAEDLPQDRRYDFILTLDCLHDMTRPADAIDAIRRALAADGTWLIKDIRCDDSWAINLNNPMLAMMYGFSLLTCMSSALSEPGGAGLGTLGFTRQRAERMTRAAGFTRFTVHDFDDPANLYYEVRH